LPRLPQYRGELPSHIKSSVHNRVVFDQNVTVIVIEKMIQVESWLHFGRIERLWCDGRDWQKERGRRLEPWSDRPFIPSEPVGFTAATQA